MCCPLHATNLRLLITPRVSGILFRPYDTSRKYQRFSSTPPPLLKNLALLLALSESPKRYLKPRSPEEVTHETSRFIPSSLIFDPRDSAALIHLHLALSMTSPTQSLRGSSPRSLTRLQRPVYLSEARCRSTRILGSSLRRGSFKQF